jgi:hypothetical protein
VTRFLKKDDLFGARWLGRPRACVLVRVCFEPRQLVLQPGPEAISLAKDGTNWARLPADWPVATAEGETIKCDKGSVRYVSTESFNPFHLVMDVPEHGDAFQ